MEGRTTVASTRQGPPQGAGILGGRDGAAFSPTSPLEPKLRKYNIISGLEGDRVDDPGSVYCGKHMRNGWKNAGLPWGYDFHPDLMWVTRET